MEGDLFTLYDGDGDQSILATRHTLKLLMPVAPPEFDNTGLVFEFVDGNFSDRIVILTSRVTISIEEQLKARGVASVVVHLFPAESTEHDFLSFDSRAVGMTIVAQKDTVLDSKVY